MKFYIKTYGCQMNVNDSEKMQHILERKGCVATQNDMDADIIIINSCAVREKPQDKIFSYAGRMPKEKIIIVAGCVAQAEKKQIMSRNRNIDAVVGTHQYYQIDEIVDDIIANHPSPVVTRFSKTWQESVPSVESRSSRVSGYISIMEGCNNFCTYCIVPFTRGREKHRPYEEIMKEARLLAENGYQEIILLGQNVNSWEDAQEGIRFTQLLDRISETVDVPWIRFITSYPGYYDEQLMDVMARHPRIVRNIHFPAQSGSTRILKKMNRIYTRPQYLDIIRKFKKRVPDITFSSDFIVGFPGETDYDFELTLSMLEAVEYENLFSFIYSPRKYTKSFDMADNLSEEAKKQRLYRLQELQKNIQLKNNTKLIGETVEVLVSGLNKKKEGEVIGRTVNYRVVNFQSATPVGEFTRVLIDNVGPYSLRGKEI
ncbi:MAG: tRNA (N6-isopentenyl adenosine(37)-C2)-methylthiotransferase MiaB [bacterium]|nr:tRNA (N6-isopentenyl adenosine(37)-C2)-methylthiotransferase MiaB [bacterium]